MATYRYLTTNILTGAVMGDWLPMIPQSMARNINAVGSFTTSLNLSAGTAQENLNNVAALENEKAVLWVLRDGVPVWVGIVWDWTPQSILTGTLDITAATPESLFQHRLITDDLTFVNTDIFDIFRALATYALGKVPNGQMAGWTMGTNQAGVTATITYTGTDMQAVYDAWTTLITTYNFEYSVRPALAPGGGLYMNLDLGYPQLGLPLGASGLAYNFPGNLLDYQFTRTGSTSSNMVYATASADGSLSAINATPTFTTSSVGDWTAVNGATVTTSTEWSNSGSGFSLSFHGNGSTANPGATETGISVTGDTQYTLSAEFYSDAGWTDCQVVIGWYSGSATLISTTTSSAASIPTDSATEVTVSATSPELAITANIYVQMTGNPSSGTVMLADDIVFAQGAPSSSSWASALPHGQDLVVLGDGYPLLEESVSMTTLTVTQQAQIDAYADGQLALVTGTQLTPLLTLGADQSPSVADTVLGSYCYFNATSPLHPAGANNEPGLQLVSRVTGWTLYPPSSQQSEYTQIQLGETEDIT